MVPPVNLLLIPLNAIPSSKISGNKEQHLSPAEERFWNDYKKNFLVNLLGGAMILVSKDQGNYTPSEGMGHAMFFAQKAGDWKTFNSLILGLERFKKPNGLLMWRINSDGRLKEGSETCATETEQNVANALLLAYEKTGREDYLKLAQGFLDGLWENATILFQGRRILLPTDSANRYWPVELNEKDFPCKSGANGLECRAVQKVIFSTSYLSPEHVVRFAKYDKKHDWNKLIDDWYEIMGLILDAASKEPVRFGIVDVNPMPDFVKLVPSGTGGIVIEDVHPKLGTGEGEWPADIIRIPLYVGMHDDPRARGFLNNFFGVMRAQGFRGPADVTLGRGLRRHFTSLTNAAIGCYGVGLQAIGEDVTESRMRLSIDKNGSFANGLLFPGPRYYRDTINFYAYFLLNGK